MQLQAMTITYRLVDLIQSLAKSYITSSNRIA